MKRALHLTSAGAARANIEGVSAFAGGSTHVLACVSTFLAVHIHVGTDVAYRYSSHSGPPPWF
jgi:hypothetical protein